MDIGITVAVQVSHPDAGHLHLLALRKNDGHWGYPGGKLDAGESILECAKRDSRRDWGKVV